MRFKRKARRPAEQLSARERQIARALRAPCIACGTDSPLGEHECKAPLKLMRTAADTSTASDGATRVPFGSGATRVLSRKPMLGGNPLLAHETIKQVVLAPGDSATLTFNQPGIYQVHVDSDLPRGDKFHLTQEIDGPGLTVERGEPAFMYPACRAQRQFRVDLLVPAAFRPVNVTIRVLRWGP